MSLDDLTKPSPITLTDLQKLQKTKRETKPTGPSQPTQELGSTNSEKEADTVKAQTRIIVRPKPKGVLEAFEDSIGGRQRLSETLSLASLDRKQAHFLNLLTDPRREKDSLAQIAKDAGLDMPSVLDLFRSSAFAAAHALALGQISAKVPAVIEDIAEKSVDAVVTCPFCFGDATDPPCAHCNGRGQITRFSDLDRQKILLEAAGVVKKGGGVNVQVQQNVAVGSQPQTFFSKYVRASDQAAYDVKMDDPTVIDVTPESADGPKGD